MEIYILRDGKETGPYSEEDTQRMLKQGDVRITDPAWKKGMAEWIPLHSVLYPAPAAETPAPQEAPVRQSWRVRSRRRFSIMSAFAMSRRSPGSRQLCW